MASCPYRHDILTEFFRPGRRPLCSLHVQANPCRLLTDALDAGDDLDNTPAFPARLDINFKNPLQTLRPTHGRPESSLLVLGSSAEQTLRK